jgi:DNA-binding MarR family transcriptional regulator
MSADPETELRQLLLAPVDPILADTNRLRVTAALIGLTGDARLSFTALRKLLGMTDGNLGQHVRVLLEVGYLSVTHVSRGRRRQSLYAATASGRVAFERHSAALAAIIAAARTSTGPARRP